MPRSPKDKQIHTDLRCSGCEHVFKGWALYVPPTRTVDPGSIPGWWAAENAAEGHRCPECGSEGIVVVKKIVYD